MTESIKKKERDIDSGGKISEKAKSYHIPLISGVDAILVLERSPVSKDDLKRIKDWIDLMEQPLTRNENSPL